MLLNTDPQGYALACQALRDYDVSNRLHTLRLPTLTVAGRYDVGTPPAATQAIAKAIPGAQFELLEAAHLAPIEHAHRFAGMLETFLQQEV